MADILIRGMEMPEDGTYSIVHIYSDGHVSTPFWGKGMQIASGITAVPLPEGHGRLIDGDAPIRVAYYDGTIHKTTASRLLCEHSLLDLPKTIVPAEEGSEDG